MNTAMYENASTQQNIHKLGQRGYHVMDTGEGELACRDTGAGRMKEPDEIVAYMDGVFQSLYDMHGMRILVSAGPTREMIDPVRFLSNRSSGKMGYAVAQAALNRGADVTLISGPVALTPPDKADVVAVTTAAEMAQQVTAYARDADIIVMAAAVADYTPAEVSKQKIKKSGDMTIRFVRTEDILKKLGLSKRAGQLLVGFAAETERFEDNAKEKLTAKKLDMIALNDVSRQGEGFGADTNNITIFYGDGSREDLGTDTKEALAANIVARMKQQYDKLTTAR
jgi:phosphopantothenoylcysteine decarboxylase/phosphopantothenate--cysteine ligase